MSIRSMLLRLALSVLTIIPFTSTNAGDPADTRAEVWPENWPKVAGLHETYQFDSAETAAVDLVLLGEDGKGLYALQCHNYLYENDPDFDYSGDFECCLKSLYSVERFSTLFTENPHQDADWDSRARFFSSDLVGGCADYPDYGAKRDFRLRGMIITLEISDYIFKESYMKVDSSEVADRDFKSFTFEITVKPDPDAETGITEPSIYAPPPLIHPKGSKGRTLDCSKIRLKTDK